MYSTTYRADALDLSRINSTEGLVCYVQSTVLVNSDRHRRAGTDDPIGMIRQSMGQMNIKAAEVATKEIQVLMT